MAEKVIPFGQVMYGRRFLAEQRTPAKVGERPARCPKPFPATPFAVPAGESGPASAVKPVTRVSPCGGWQQHPQRSFT